jgi:hypothetical protein
MLYIIFYVHQGVSEKNYSYRVGKNIKGPKWGTNWPLKLFSGIFDTVYRLCLLSDPWKKNEQEWDGNFAPSSGVGVRRL